MSSSPQRSTLASVGSDVNIADSDALVTVSDVGFDYEESRILDQISFNVGRGEFVALVGPSGCGKSTILNLISGVLAPESGHISADGLTDHNDRLGRVSYMQQKDLLLPWRTVAENGRLGLELRGVPKSEAADRVRELATSFGIEDVLDSMPHELSGGMRQRVALLRAVLPDNSVILLDEPFGALDAITRSSLQRWLSDVLDRSDKAVLLVTHDVEEAILLADRVLVMAPNPGRIVAEEALMIDSSLGSEAMLTGEFIALKRHILNLLNDSEMGFGASR
jgi:ABC-type nitrate/sulfonate/bicarbonate transport system ATPase subunit